MESFSRERELMVKQQLLPRGIDDSRVIKALRQVSREKFVPPQLQDRAYEDSPLPIGYGQTISQPYIVALMSQLLELKGKEKVLEIGTGSGYQTAVLALLARKVISLERIQPLAQQAQKRLKQLNYSNVKVFTADGTKGWPLEAPFDAILCAAATKKIPLAWQKQLKEGGRIVVPLVKGFSQELVRLTKKGKRLVSQSFGSVVFVPLITSFK